MPELTSSCVWPISDDLVSVLDGQLGTPTDSYLNGSQTWIRPSSTIDTELEWRLHPVANYKLPNEISHYDLWDIVTRDLAMGSDISLGEVTVTINQLWDGLECFSIDDNDVEPAEVARATTEELGIAPIAFGTIDHEAIGDAWSAHVGLFQYLVCSSSN